MSYISDKILYTVEKPARYTGGELNSVVKDKSKVSVRIAFCYPDIYDIGMSYPGMKILYRLLNSIDDIWCERVFAPWTDLEKIMREQGLKLFALESQEEIRNFDIVMFTMQYEMGYTNILNMLELAGIPVKAKDRGDDYPLILGGGPSTLNPEPMSEFFDLFNLGEGEEMLPEIMEVFKRVKKKKGSKKEFLREAAKIEGVYVPSFYDVEYNEDGTIKRFGPKEEFKDVAKPRIRKRIVRDLNKMFAPDKINVAFVPPVHDRIMLEIFRGCIRGCRFCQAGFIYRPVREKNPDVLMQNACELVKNTGYDEISLLSLSTSDYTMLPELTERLIDEFEPRKISLSLPSLRVDSFSMDLMDRVSSLRKSGITFAPEAGTQRMRDIINKGITEEDILHSAELAFNSGRNNIKLYFMLGLPEETDEDLLGIPALAKKVLGIYDRIHAGKKARRPEITVSVSTFVPKPHTPFQWREQISKEEILRRQTLIKTALDRRISFSWHDAETSVLEAAMSRGDRRTGDVIYSAWKMGQTFDAWQEHMNFDNWKKAYAENGLDMSFYNERKRNYDEILPWDVVDICVTKEFLQREDEKATRGELTPNCREKCSHCGAVKYRGGLCVDKIQDKIR